MRSRIRIHNREESRISPPPEDSGGRIRGHAVAAAWTRAARISPTLKRVVDPNLRGGGSRPSLTRRQTVGTEHPKSPATVRICT